MRNSFIKNKDFCSKYGFVHIPVMVAVLIGIFIIGGMGFAVVNQYQGEKKENEELLIERKRTKDNQNDNLEKPKQDIKLFKQQSVKESTKPIAPATAQPRLEDPQVKIERCRTSAEVQARKEAANIALQRIEDGGKLCESDLAISDKTRCLQNIISLADDFRKSDEERLHDEYYMVCLSQ